MSGRGSIATRLAKGEPVHWAETAYHDGPQYGDSKFSEFILNAVKVDVQNVADYLNEESTMAKGFDYRKDLPNVAPPFRQMFFEYRVASGRKVGVGIHATELPAGYNHRWKLEWFAMMVDDWNCIRAACRSTWPVRPDGRLETAEARRIDTEPVTVSYFFPELGEHLKECEKCQPDPATGHLSLDTKDLGSGFEPDSPTDRVAKSMVSLLLPALLAISFMHCKNVDLIDHPHRQPPKKKKAKHRKKPRIEWKVLVIEPMKKVLAGPDGKHLGETLAQRLHICRGHWKDYRQSGLFGKYKGVYWWHSHLKGTEGDGVVHKSYEVHKPEEVSDEHKRTA